MLLERGIPPRYIFNKIKVELIWFTIYSSAIYFLKEVFNLGFFIVPLNIAAILGTAISLLLAFRTSQSYDRWWESRKVWGAIVNDSRTLVRQVLSFISTDMVNDPAVKEVYTRFAYRQMGWCYALGQALRKLEVVPDLQKFVAPHEVEEAREHDNIPNFLLQVHNEDIRILLEKGAINPYQQVQIDATIARLCDSMGKCERIKNTVFPRTYSKFLHFFIYVFITILPLGLVDVHGFLEVPLVVTMAGVFFLIEKTSIHLQDPFENKPTDTAMTSIARTIEINIRQMLGERKQIEKIKPEKFYIM